MKTIEAYNNKLSGIYDSATLAGKWSAPAKAKKLLSEFKLIKNNLAVLDLGLGTGQTIKPFVKKNCEIFGIDISAEMIKVTQNKYPGIKTFKHDLNNGIGKNNFKKEYFDIIMAIGVLEFITNIERIIKQSYQLLKKNGYFLFTYEILLSNNKFQKTRIQYNEDGYVEASSSKTKFKLYRRSRVEIDNLLKDIGYKIIKQLKFKAFLKGKNKIPVYYEIVLVKK